MANRESNVPRPGTTTRGLSFLRRPTYCPKGARPVRRCHGQRGVSPPTADRETCKERWKAVSTGLDSASRVGLERFESTFAPV